jgi:hypothetical protein
MTIAVLLAQTLDAAIAATGAGVREDRHGGPAT